MVDNTFCSPNCLAKKYERAQKEQWVVCLFCSGPELYVHTHSKSALTGPPKKKLVIVCKHKSTKKLLLANLICSNKHTQPFIALRKHTYQLIIS